MCIDIERIVATDGNFDGIPPAGITFENYISIMNPEADSGSFKQKTVYKTR